LGAYATFSSKSVIVNLKNEYSLIFSGFKRSESERKRPRLRLIRRLRREGERREKMLAILKGFACQCVYNSTITANEFVSVKFRN